MIELIEDKLNFSKHNEWELALKQEKALEEEDFETCNAIKKEIDNRIEYGTINKALMSGFRYWNPKTKEFQGKPKLPNVNGLFNKYEAK